MNEIKIKNWPLVGNDKVISFLESNIQRSLVSGAYIFSGSDNLGKTTLAMYFSKILQCQSKDGYLPCDKCKICLDFNNTKGEMNSDFRLIKLEKDKKNIAVAQVREFISSLNMTSFHSKYKIGIIKHADRLSIGAANALLKTLEEPKKNVVIILVTSSLELLPATIVSRSKVINFQKVRSSVIYDYLVEDCSANRDRARDISKVSMGRPALAKKFLEDKDFFNDYNNRADIFLNLIEGEFNQSFLMIESLFGKKESLNESAKISRRVLEIWQSIARDVVLLKNDQDNLVRHVFLMDKLKGLANYFSSEQMIDFFKRARKAELYINANVSPKFALQNVLLFV